MAPPGKEDDLLDHVIKYLAKREGIDKVGEQGCTHVMSLAAAAAVPGLSEGTGQHVYAGQAAQAAATLVGWCSSPHTPATQADARV